MRLRQFRYFADPICISAVLLYLLNRFCLKPNGIGGMFGSCYFNDLLCLPLFLPMILWVQGRLRLRLHDHPPRMWEILQHWVIFSVLFEVILPRYPQYFHTTTDPLDVAAYLAGGVLAWLWWRKSTARFRLQVPRPLYFWRPARAI